MSNEEVTEKDVDYMINLLKYTRRIISNSRWTPCSERLPEEEGDYWLTVEIPCPRSHIATGVSRRFVCEGGYWDGEFTADCEAANQKTVAWMKYPAPYEGE